MNTIADNSRVWIYLCDKELSEQEVQRLHADTEAFLKDWNAHGTALSSMYEIIANRFIVIAVNEDAYGASGCSIDKQLQFIQATEKKYSIQLLNRLLVAYQNKDRVEVVHSSKVPALLTEGILNRATPVYQTALTTGREYNQTFTAPLSQTWLSRFLVE